MSWTDGYVIEEIMLPHQTRSLVIAQDWKKLDQLMAYLVAPTGHVFEKLKKYASFNSIEHMLALRDGANPEEEDGIWHDDSSRVLAFSLSLNFYGLPTGGELEIRPRQGEGKMLGPYGPGRMIVFRTGKDNFEHRTHKVQSGLRLVCAGWCN